jgi:hypothetical protein
MDQQGSMRRLSAAPASAPFPAYQLPEPSPGTQVAPSPPPTQRSPSTAEPSPLLPFLHDRQRSYAEPNATPTPGRTALACESCRRSKVKCVHKDFQPPCKQCAQRNVPCVFKPPSLQSKDKTQRDSVSSQLDVSALFNFSSVDLLHFLPALPTWNVSLPTFSKSHHVLERVTRHIYNDKYFARSKT